jgi:hypothetical protein
MLQVAATLEVFQPMFCWIRGNEKSVLSIDYVLEKAQDAVYRYGIRGLVIDPYNEMEHNRPGNQTETEYVSRLLSKVSVTRSDACMPTLLQRPNVLVGCSCTESVLSSCKGSEVVWHALRPAMEWGLQANAGQPSEATRAPCKRECTDLPAASCRLNNLR